MTDTAPRPVGRPKLPPRENVSTMTVRDVSHATKAAMLALVQCKMIELDDFGEFVMECKGNSLNSVALFIFEAGLRHVRPLIAQEIETAAFDSRALNDIAQFLLRNSDVDLPNPDDFEDQSDARTWLLRNISVTASLIEDGVDVEPFEVPDRNAALFLAAEAGERLERLEIAMETLKTALAPA